MKNKYHIWTKAEIRKVMELWEQYSTEELAEKLSLQPAQVTYIAKQLRLEGVNLSKRQRAGTVRGLIAEILKEK